MGTSLDPFLVYKPGQSLGRAIDFATSSLATFVRLGSGGMVGTLGARPERRLVLYQIENCPFSRKVREALSILDIDVDVRPCPKGSVRFRAELTRDLHLKEEVPVLVDPNTAEVIQDSDKAVAYLFQTYGRGSVPLPLRMGPLTNASSFLASTLRGLRGSRAVPSSRPELELELFGYEASPYCRLVRERLEELAIPYVLRNLARNSPRRPDYEKRVGMMQFPYLVDPNTGAAMFESEAIVDYLDRTYGNPESVPAKVDIKRESASKSTTLNGYVRQAPSA